MDLNTVVSLQHQHMLYTQNDNAWSIAERLEHGLHPEYAELQTLTEGTALSPSISLTCL